MAPSDEGTRTNNDRRADDRFLQELEVVPMASFRRKFILPLGVSEESHEYREEKQKVKRHGPNEFRMQGIHRPLSAAYLQQVCDAGTGPHQAEVDDEKESIWDRLTFDTGGGKSATLFALGNG